MAELDNDCDDCDDLPTVGLCAKVTTAQDRINARYDGLFHWDKNGNARAHVCAFCDKLLMHQDDVKWLPIESIAKPKCRQCLDWSSIVKNEANRIPEVEVECTYSNPDDLIPNHLKIALAG